ncbi:MAG: hypothetical protein KJ646_02420 [Nanoarchaeota archaeon]|nr:hypothetical protein [Nanoarchaeota archaeon]
MWRSQVFKKIGMPPSYSVCPGCVFTNVPPEDCIHHSEDMKAPSVQSDLLCPHCYIIAEESGETFQLHADKNLEQKIAELEKIIEMSID